MALATLLAAAPAAMPSQGAAPARIVSLVPAVTEMLFAMGAGAQVVGVSSYDRFPPEVASRPKVGALVDPDFERILSLRPDLVIVYGTQADLVARLGRARVPVYSYAHAGLSDVPETIRRVGERVGHAAEARTVVDRIGRELEAVRERVRGRVRPRTALVFEREPGVLRGMYASGGIGFMHDLLELAGGTNVFADVKRQSLQLSAETLLARQPDMIIELHPAAGWSAAIASRERDVWKALGSLPAVRTGRVHLLADDRLAVPGPRVAESAAILADVLHPRGR